MASRVIDMTSGSTLGHLIRFSLPLLVGNLFQQLYNTVDSLVVGNYVGKNALAAVGSCGTLSWLLWALSAGVSAGVGILVAQFFGAGDSKSVKRTIASSLYVLGTSSIIITVLGVIFAPEILQLLHTPAELMEDAVLYLRITTASLIAAALGEDVICILQALGDSRTPLICTVIGCIVNIILDLIFVVQFHAGVLGVALATVIGQLSSIVFGLIYAYRLPFFRMTREELLPDRAIIRKTLRLGVPLALQSSLIAISCLVLQSVVNSFGATVVAAYTIISRIEQFVQMPYTTLSTAVTNYTGQNAGAGNLPRVRKGLRISILLSLIFSLFMLAPAWCLGGPIVSCFVKDADVIAMGATALRITSVCYFPLGLIYMPRAVLNGVGDARFAMIIGGVEIVCRIIFSYVFIQIPFIGVWGIWVTEGATWTLTAAGCLIHYFAGHWKRFIQTSSPEPKAAT